MKNIIIIGLGLMALLTTGCVTKGTHEATLAELGKTQDSLTTANSKIDAQSEKINKQNTDIEAQKLEDLVKLVPLLFDELTLNGNNHPNLV